MTLTNVSLVTGAGSPGAGRWAAGPWGPFLHGSSRSNPEPPLRGCQSLGTPARGPRWPRAPDLPGLLPSPSVLLQAGHREGDDRGEPAVPCSEATSAGVTGTPRQPPCPQILLLLFLDGVPPSSEKSSSVAGEPVPGLRVCQAAEGPAGPRPRRGHCPLATALPCPVPGSFFFCTWD